LDGGLHSVDGRLLLIEREVACGISWVEPLRDCQWLGRMLGEVF
jgi:hypothetical protein